MQWRKLGLVWTAGGAETAGFTHAMAPTPVRVSEEILRIYVTLRDRAGRGHVGLVDVLAEDPRQVVRATSHNVLSPGQAGRFDDNGVVPMSVLQQPDGRLLLFYSGFQLCTDVPYRIFSGLAVSEDGGLTFRRLSPDPILPQSPAETDFRCATFAMHDGVRFRLWYIAGSEWTNVYGKQVPVYDLRYAESSDGLTWPSKGQSSLVLTDEDEHGFGRPWIVKKSDMRYQLFYSVRRKSLGAYRLGYAESIDGLAWARKDHEMGLDVSPGQFDGRAISYSATLNINGRELCFYNGDDFGLAGFAVAERVD